MPGAASACLDDNALLDLVEGRLDAERRVAALAHTDGCDACRVLLVEAMRAARADTSVATDETQAASGSEDSGAASPLLRPGERVGRYVVLGVVGAGGMGVVYAAFDPELDRKVALKLLRVDPSGSDGGEALSRRLQREAQAMARLSHPNIVTVFDAGTYESRVFLAMDFVVGETLSQWLVRGGHTRREILAVLVKAGRGLCAAHAAGIVHRDFKPDNVLVGKDGRVLVSDFGLARAVGGADEPFAPRDPQDSSPLVSAPSELATPLTVPGAVAGTPAYMAPEQAAGAVADVRTDLYAYCVTAYEALVGRRPFAGRSVEELRAAMGQGRIEPEPRHRALPGYLRRVLLRGLHPQPGQRLQSMAELLAVLEHDPRRLWLRLGAAAGVLALVGGAVLVQAFLHEAPATRCAGGDARLLGVWDDARQREVAEGLGRLSLSYGGSTVERVGSELDAYRADWLVAYRRACEATHVRGEQSEALLDRRMACLERRRGELRALVDVLAKADSAVAERAVTAARSLAPVAACANHAELLAVEPPSAGAAEGVAVAEELMSRAKAFGAAGRAREALRLAQEALARARTAGHRPTLAEAELLCGTLLYEVEDYPKSEEALRGALAHAHAGRADTVAASALVELVYAVGIGKREHVPAAVWAQLADAALERIGEPSGLRVRLHSARANIAIEQRKLDVALAELRASLQLEESKYGSEHPRVARVLGNFAKLRAAQGDFVEALRLQGRVLELDEHAYGPEHPLVAEDLIELGTAQFYHYDFAGAARSLQRSLELKQRVLGEDAAGLWRDHNVLGSVLGAHGDFEGARRHLLTAVRIARQVLGEKDYRLAMPLHNVAELYTKEARFELAEDYYGQAEALTVAKLGVDNEAFAIHLYGRMLLALGGGRLDDAERHGARALLLREKALGPAHPDVASVVHLLGIVALRRGRLELAGQLLEKSRGVRETALGPQHPDLAESLVGLADLALLRGDPETALRHATRAGAMQRARGGEIGTIADRRFAQARALAALRREPARARRLAEAAVAGYARVPYYSRELASARAFLARLSAP